MTPPAARRRIGEGFGTRAGLRRTGVAALCFCRPRLRRRRNPAASQRRVLGALGLPPSPGGWRFCSPQARERRRRSQPSDRAPLIQSIQVAGSGTGLMLSTSPVSEKRIPMGPSAPSGRPLAAPATASVNE